MDDLLPGLLRNAYLFDDPAAYEAGVRDAIAAVTVHSEVRAVGADDEAARVARGRRAHPSGGRGRTLHVV